MFLKSYIKIVFFFNATISTVAVTSSFFFLNIKASRRCNVGAMGEDGARDHCRSTCGSDKKVDMETCAGKTKHNFRYSTTAPRTMHVEGMKENLADFSLYPTRRSIRVTSPF